MDADPGCGHRYREEAVLVSVGVFGCSGNGCVHASTGCVALSVCGLCVCV